MSKLCWVHGGPAGSVRRLLLVLRVSSLLLLALLGGCAAAPKEMAQGAVFYPPLPNPPRIQYLASFSGENDLGEKLGEFGEFVLGDETDDGGSVKKPYGVAIHDGKIYVVDTRGGGYAIFDLKARKYLFIRGSGGGGLKKPINIAVDGDGTKYITDTLRGQVVAYSRNDNYKRAYGEEGQFKPSGVAVTDDRLYVTDLAHHNVHVLDKATGQALFTFGENVDSEEQRLHSPTNIAIHDSHAYITDTINARVQKYTLEGEYVDGIGSLGSGLGMFARPKGLAVDRRGRLYVIDAAFENVQIFTNDGRLLLFFGGAGDAPESMNMPTSLVIDYDNLQYFQRYAAPGFKLEYVILVASQFGRSKVNAYGMGRLEGMDYMDEEGG